MRKDKIIYFFALRLGPEWSGRPVDSNAQHSYQSEDGAWVCANFAKQT